MAGWKTLPGETPIDDISGLKIKGIATRAQLNDFEGANIRKAVLKYLSGRITRRTAPFNLTWAQRLHKEMFSEVWKWGGAFRTSDTNLGLAWHQVETGLQNLLNDLAYWKGHSVDLLEQAAMLHHRAVYIHPFLNGNGRWSRMLANIWLWLHDHPPTHWPEETLGEESVARSEYLTAIRAADDGDYGPLIDLHRRHTPGGPKVG